MALSTEWPEAFPVKHLEKGWCSLSLGSQEGGVLRAIDLFAGIGGMRLASAQSNFETVFASEIKPSAIEIYQKNFGHTPVGDITAVPETDVPDHDLLMAGFPCQPFSNSGTRRGFLDTRGTLFFDIARIISAKRPEAVLLENVKGLIHHDEGRTLRVILETLNNLGYSTSHAVLNARDFGLPQNRERIIIVALQGESRFIDLTPPLLTFRPRLRDMLDTAEADAYLDPSEYTLIPESQRIEQRSGLIFVGYRNKNLRKKGARPNTEHLSRVHKQPNRIYSIEGVAPTISASESSGRYFILDDRGVRKLSSRELFRIMGFPEKYQFCGTESSIRSAIGNSVPVPLIAEVVNRISQAISKPLNHLDPLEEWMSHG